MCEICTIQQINIQIGNSDTGLALIYSRHYIMLLFACVSLCLLVFVCTSKSRASVTLSTCKIALWSLSNSASPAHPLNCICVFALMAQLISATHTQNHTQKLKIERQVNVDEYWPTYPKLGTTWQLMTRYQRISYSSPTTQSIILKRRICCKSSVPIAGPLCIEICISHEAATSSFPRSGGRSVTSSGWHTAGERGSAHWTDLTGHGMVWLGVGRYGMVP